MAKIVASFDTKEKTLSCTIDGKAVSNIQEIVMYKGYEGEDFTMSLMTAAKDDESGMTRMERIVAAESTQGRELKNTGRELVSQFEEFYKTEPLPNSLEKEFAGFAGSLFKGKK